MITRFCNLSLENHNLSVHLIRSLLVPFKHTAAHREQRINLTEIAPIYLPKSKLLVNCSWTRRSRNVERQKLSHILTSPPLAAFPQKGYCPSFKRTPLSNFQALNEFTQLKVLHHFPLCVFSHGIGIYGASALAKMYQATSLLHYSIWWSHVWEHQREYFWLGKQTMYRCLTHQACSLSKSHTGSLLPSTDVSQAH